MPTVESNRSAKSGMSKSAFVRSLPNRLPAKEVVELAKKEGLRLSDKYVYVVRSNARRKGGRRGRRRMSTVVVVGKATGTEKEFRRLALELGVKRAEEILTDTKKRVRQIIAGA